MAEPARALAAEPPLRLSYSNRMWRLPAADPRLTARHAQMLGVPGLLAQILAARGVGAEAAADFLAPTLRALMPDPSALAGMDAAADRLARAVRGGETVAVFGDYDVDGACASALLARLLTQLGCAVLSYVPDRLTEGYGPNAAALRGLVAQGARLIVCVDCGTTAGAALAAVAGAADVLVLDHHAAANAPEGVCAIVNPNLPGDRSGLRALCATGVVFLAAVALLRVLRRLGHFGATAEPDLRGFLDLVCLATVCDMMPLTGLNRAFVAQGLKLLANPRPGLAALLAVAEARGAATVATCGFLLGPRLNAAGRIADASLGLKLLLTEDAAEAAGLAHALDAINRQRQGVEAAMLAEAEAEAAWQVAAGRAVILIAAPQWHVGVVGIVAGRLKEKFNRPAAVAALADGVARGSGRSVRGLDLGAAIASAAAAGLLLTGGGHAMACGFSLAAERVPALHDFLDARLEAARALPPAPELVLDAALSVEAADVGLAEQIGRLAPFGEGNPEPVFLLRRAQVAYAARIGRDLTTVRADVVGETGARLKAIAFRAAEVPFGRAWMARDGPVDLAGHLRAESWNGRSSASFCVLDAAPVA